MQSVSSAGNSHNRCQARETRAIGAKRGKLVQSVSSAGNSCNRCQARETRAIGVKRGKLVQSVPLARKQATNAVAARKNMELLSKVIKSNTHCSTTYRFKCRNWWCTVAEVIVAAQLTNVDLKVNCQSGERQKKCQIQ